MEGANNLLADKLAELCYKKYENLPRTGKPNEMREWTLLAGVVMVHEDPNSESDLSERTKVVAQGTGTKCLGQKKMSPQGDLLNDSHAEIMARRGFIRYLYQQVLITYQTGTSDVFDRFDSGKCFLRNDITFHFFTSHTPCGDASIIPMTTPNAEDIGSCLNTFNCHSEDIGSEKTEPLSKYRTNCLANSSDNDYIDKKLKGDIKRKLCDTDNAKEAKQPRISDTHNDRNSEISTQNALLEKNKLADVNDVHRTGAKCLPSELLQDPHLPGAAYHIEGALRTKPGRGDPTLSLSCSDKLARWNVVGVQGALLALLMDQPIYFNTVIIGGGCPFSEAALKRAVIDRLISKQQYALSVTSSPLEHELNLPSSYAVHNAKFMQASKCFVHARTPGKQPCPSSIVWCDVPERSLEIAVEGRKQGVTKKAAHTPKGRLAVCKKELLQTFIKVVKAMPNSTLYISNIINISENESEVIHCLSDLTYKDVKNLSKNYQQAWSIVKDKCFPAWKSKPDSLITFKAAD